MHDASCVTSLVQVDRLKPRFRQFILEGCTAQHTAESGARSTPLRGRMADVHGSFRLEAARKSLAFEANENVLKPPQAADDPAPARPNRLVEIRRRMGTLGARDTSADVRGPDGFAEDSALGDRYANNPRKLSSCDRYGCLLLPQRFSTIFF